MAEVPQPAQKVTASEQATVKRALIGPPPILSKLDEGGGPSCGIDFRVVYATLVGCWLAVNPEPFLDGRAGTLAVF